MPITKQQIISEIQDFYQKNHKWPTSRTFSKKDTATKLFGSWRQALIESGTDVRRKADSSNEELKIFIKNNCSISNNGCWLWKKNISDNGYGLTTYQKSAIYTHRLSYILFNEPILDGNIIRHTCNIKNCCNPDHLKQGSYTENRQDQLDLGTWKINNVKPKRPYRANADEIWNWLKLSIKKEVDGGYSSKCWISDYHDLNNYGWMIQKKQLHRWVHEYHSMISKNQVVGHACNNKGCFNPDHLYSASRTENAYDTRCHRKNILLTAEIAADVLEHLVEYDTSKSNWKKKFSRYWFNKISVDVTDLRCGNSWIDVRTKIEEKFNGKFTNEGKFCERAD